MLLYTHLSSSVGPLLIAGRGDAIERLHFCSGPKAMQPAADWVEDHRPFREASRQLELYFAGKLREFALELAPDGTEFQLMVWRELRRIPYGETVSYGELARRAGNPSAARAAGLANGANPIAILIPCHRVIGASGKLTGFGGGLAIKRQLLALESGERSLPLQA